MGTYKRNAYAKKRNYKRTYTLAKRKPFYKKVQRIAKQVVNKNLEVKSCMIAASEQTVSTLNTVQGLELLTNIAQGTSNLQRVGNKIKLIGCQIKYLLQNNGTVPVYVRTSLLKYQDRVSLSATTDLFHSTSGGSSDIADLLSTSALMLRPYNPVFAKPYWDRIVRLSAYSGEAIGSFKKVTKFIKFGKGINVTYNGGSSTLGNIVPYINFLTYAAESGNDTSTGTVIEMTYQIRLFYTDA